MSALVMHAAPALFRVLLALAAVAAVVAGAGEMEALVSLPQTLATALHHN